MGLIDSSKFEVSIAACRTNCKKTQEEMAKAIGVSRPTYLKYENDEISPPADKLLAIANMANLPIDFLVNHIVKVKG